MVLIIFNKYLNNILKVSELLSSIKIENMFNSQYISLNSEIFDIDELIIECDIILYETDFKKIDNKILSNIKKISNLLYELEIFVSDNRKN